MDFPAHNSTTPLPSSASMPSTHPSADAAGASAASATVMDVGSGFVGGSIKLRAQAALRSRGLEAFYVDDIFERLDQALAAGGENASIPLVSLSFLFASSHAFLL